MNTMMRTCKILTRGIQTNSKNFNLLAHSKKNFCSKGPNKQDNNENNDKDKKKDENNKQNKWNFRELKNIEKLGLICGGSAVLFLLFSRFTESFVPKEITLGDFYKLVQAKEVKLIHIVKNEYTNLFEVYFETTSMTKNKIVIQNHEFFIRELERIQIEKGIPFQEFINIKFSNDASSLNGSNTKNLLSYSFIFTIGLGMFFFTRSKGGLDKIFKSSSTVKGKTDSSFKKPSPFDILSPGRVNVKDAGETIKTKFKEVAGLNESKKEIMEFVDFLKFPKKYHDLGAKLPKGALLVGPPGTGKTLLAKAVAGEAEVPFFAISGSEFVEMFVGVGASRVRDLFKKAKEKSPSIIFIDEIDAVGRKRNNQMGGNDERENTLNQLLVEMDGFGTDNSVIVLAATNRKDILDPALLRPGRFDRTVEINLPDRKDRDEILKIYLNKIKLDGEKNIDEYASRLSTLTPGFSGADLSNLVNEAAIISARENKESVDSTAFEKASERIIAGLETKRVLTVKERKTVAYHESGHAVVGWLLEHSSPLVKVTIIPRSKGSLGFAQYLPDDVSLHSKEELHEMICVALGGRIAEEIFFKTITSGAADDLHKVTSIAKSIVSKFGMSDLGLLTYNVSDESYIKPYSNSYEKKIEMETNKIINMCYEKTKVLLNENKDKVEKLALKLLDKETLDLVDLIEVLGERKFPLSESIKGYLDEINKRKAHETEKKKEEENIKKFENEIEINPQPLNESGNLNK